jgi:hypothetical protein
MPSIEILVEQAGADISTAIVGYSFAVRISDPPLSDREPSRWQHRFVEIGGALVHVGDKRFANDAESWYFAYDLLDIHKSTRFQFKPEYASQFAVLLTRLVSTSAERRIHFTSDWQFGPSSSRVYRRRVSLEKFVQQHNELGIRFNSWLTIAGP